jgi:hypothetical protein
MEERTALLVLPWVGLVVGALTRDAVGLALAGLIWLPQVRTEGRQRTLAVVGLVLLALIAALVAWVKFGGA